MLKVLKTRVNCSFQIIDLFFNVSCYITLGFCNSWLWYIYSNCSWFWSCFRCLLPLPATGVINSLHAKPPRHSSFWRTSVFPLINSYYRDGECGRQRDQPVYHHGIPVSSGSLARLLHRNHHLIQWWKNQHLPCTQRCLKSTAPLSLIYLIGRLIVKWTHYHVSVMYFDLSFVCQLFPNSKGGSRMFSFDWRLKMRR